MKVAKTVNTKTGAITNENKKIRTDIENSIRGSEAIQTEAPDSLCEVGKQTYKQIIKSLPEDYLSNVDVHIVTVVSDSVAQLEKLREQINELGPLQASESKLIIAYQKYSDILNKFSSLLGLSPQSRAQLAHIFTKQKQAEKDPLLQVLQKHKATK